MIKRKDWITVATALIIVLLVVEASTTYASWEATRCRTQLNWGYLTGVACREYWSPAPPFSWHIKALTSTSNTVYSVYAKVEGGDRCGLGIWGHVISTSVYASYTTGVDTGWVQGDNYDCTYSGGAHEYYTLSTHLFMQYGDSEWNGTSVLW